jgi:Protein of unknown function (DUF4232)
MQLPNHPGHSVHTWRVNRVRGGRSHGWSVAGRSHDAARSTGRGGHAAGCGAGRVRVTGTVRDGRPFGRGAGGTGTAHADLYFTNVGSMSCSLSGEPKRVEFLRIDGRALAITPQGPEPPPVPAATLGPGVRDAASVAYNWGNWCGTTPGPLHVRVELPTGGNVTGPFDGPPGGVQVPRCDQPDQPSSLILLWGFANPTP